MQGAWQNQHYWGPKGAKTLCWKLKCWKLRSLKSGALSPSDQHCTLLFFISSIILSKWPCIHRKALWNWHGLVYFWKSNTTLVFLWYTSTYHRLIVCGIYLILLVFCIKKNHPKSTSLDAQSIGSVSWLSPMLTMVNMVHAFLTDITQ